MRDHREAIDRGLDWLAASQLPSGELPSFASPLDAGEPAWVPDELNFITALGAVALGGLDDPRAAGVVDRAVRCLQAEREWPGLWRYWSRANVQADWTPPDADDTACCSLAVALRGHRTDGNVAVLLATAEDDGRFRTWLIPRRAGGGPRVWWALRDERRTATRAERDRLWATTEADPDDVDAVVNANVIRYLGPERAPAGAVDWVASIVEAGADSGDKWHRSPWALWAAVADGARRGVDRFAALLPTLVSRVAAAADEGALARAYDAALALRVAQAGDAPAALRARVAAHLVAFQGPDGAWPREVVYHGGPREVFAWASEALVTASAVGALAAEGAP